MTRSCGFTVIVVQQSTQPLTPLYASSRFRFRFHRHLFLRYSTTSASTSAAVRGRPGIRDLLPSYFSPISFRCQANKALGVTIVGSWLSTSRPSFFLDCEPTALLIVESHSATADLLPKNSAP